MKRIYLVLSILIIIDLLFQRCANPISPTGGPKDTIPPILLNVEPIIGTTNFNQQTITLEFNEFINADKLKQNLVITPKSDFTYKHQIKRMELTLKFEEPFKDSTTYSLNFFDGVTDITEKNPAVNLYLAFSTGSFIDSMSISGTVSDLLTQKKMEGFTVALYPKTDSLNYISDNPTYFTTTDKKGKYQIKYIKSGIYKLISFDDDNRNLLLDPETESHGFISDSINLITLDTSQYHIRTQLLNVKPITYINSRPTGPYIESKYSREIYSYTLSPDSISSIIVGENRDGIRLYNRNQFNFNDSVEFIINAKDSIGNSTIDTIKTVFIDSNRKLPSFSSNIENKANQELKDNQQISVVFNKPIISIDTSLFFLKKDSTFLYPLNPTFEWNDNRDKLKISTNIIIDSLLTKYEESLPLDTTQLDSISDIALDKNKKSDKREFKKPTLQFTIGKATFISIENDTSKTRSLNFKTKTSQSYGSLNINANTDLEKFTIQLLSSGKVSYEIKNTVKASFPRVKPGNYSIRVLIDDNEDGIWSYGNILQNEEPETVYIHPDDTSIRENWVIDVDISF